MFDDYRTIANIENPVYQSYQGKYFIGQSKLLSFGFDGYAYGGLFNPSNSGVNLFFNVFTVTNTADVAIKARIYVNASIPDSAFEVDVVSPANLTIKPPPHHKVKFLASQFFNEEITDGKKLFTRMIPPKSTVVIEKKGLIILPPGDNISIELVPPADVAVKADIACGFWEEPINVTVDAE